MLNFKIISERPILKPAKVKKKKKTKVVPQWRHQGKQPVVTVQKAWCLKGVSVYMNWYE